MTVEAEEGRRVAAGRLGASQERVPEELVLFLLVE